MTKYLFVAALVAVGVASLMAASPAFQPHPEADAAQALALRLSAETQADIARQDAATRATLFGSLGPLAGLALLAVAVGLPAVLALRVVLLYRTDQQTLDAVHHLVLHQPNVTVTLQTGRHHITIDTVQPLSLPQGTDTP